MRASIFFLVVFAALFSVGCATRSIQPVKFENGLEAGLVLGKLQKSNESLDNFKCSGTIEIHNDDESFNARTVMCVKPPSSFRLEALSPAGPPAFRMSGDTESIYIQPEPSGQIYKKDAKGATLEKLAGIEIQVQDMINLLCGRPAVVPDGSLADLKLDPHDKSAKALVIYDVAGNILQRLKLDESNSIQSAEIFDSSGKSIYSAEFSGAKQVGGFVFPGKVFVKAGNKELKLAIRQIWPNTDIKENLFVLTAPATGNN
ncbi:lipoprotein insertase outer membrane protein LolB [Desulforegula conservatrix]|uniref:lipoprotein insertase outer membrane protein LolB n=1 Tax=Desulforegula conservatrix TaxID=153026 RepID=UPI000408D5B4|nr:lipoprotein insertase outer membrane protein LolB [Desulforegula conservatrix]